MEALAVAVALCGGELVPGIISSIDGHPLLEVCGIARSVPDLMRLLERFAPAALFVSTSFVEELGQPDLGPEDAARLSAPVTFLITHGGAGWGEEKLAEMFRLPLKYGGLISADGHGEGDVHGEVRRKLDLFCSREGVAGPAQAGKAGPGGGSGLLAVMGCKGGVGATLFACSLAAAMSSCGRRVLLMETAREQSHLLYLKPGGEGKAVLDLLPMAEELSWDLVRMSVYRHAMGFHLLPFAGAEGPAADALVPDSFLRNLLFLFDHVIQDLQACSPRGVPALLHHDPQVLLVSLPDIMAATCARGVAARLRRAGLEYDRLKLVVNRCGSHHVLSPRELAQAAAAELFATLPVDQRSGLDFAELGELPRPDSPLGRAVTDAAAALGCGCATSSALRTRRLRRPWGRSSDIT